MTSQGARLDKKRAILLFSLLIGVLGLSEINVDGFNIIFLSYIGFPVALVILLWVWLIQG